MRDELNALRDAAPAANGPDPEFARQLRGELITNVSVVSTRRLGTRRGLPLALPAMALVVLAVLVSGTLFGRGDGAAWGAAQVRVAQASPRLLVRELGRKVIRADQFDVGVGEMTCASGGLQLDLHWQPAA